MSNLLRHKEVTNNAFTNKIINAIKDDKDWLFSIGISENELNKKEIIPDFIKNHITNPENIKTIDLLLKYVLTDCLNDDDSIPLIKHLISADSYSGEYALFVFKCGDLYFCYFLGEEIETLITKKPEDFCWASAKTIIDNYKMEKENLKDDWFNDSNNYNTLNLNFDFDKS